MLDNQGRLPTTDELYRQYHGIGASPEEEIPDPFAETGQSHGSEPVEQEEIENEESKPGWEWCDEG